MGLFLGVHKFPTDGDVKEMTSKSWGKYKQAAEEMGLKPLHALVGYESGKAYCETEAESKEQVEEAHNKAEVPFEEILEVVELS